jgi:putative membrane protein
MDLYNNIKALHLIFVITWFAGLFYIVRLFVYQIEAQSKPSPEKEILGAQYKIMTYRLWYIITWPSAVLATLFVVLLLAYHFKCHQIYKQLQNDDTRYSSNFMRLWNEGATIILFAVVFLVILKNAIDWIYGVVGIIGFSILIMLGFKFYKNIRKKNKS